MLVLLIGFVKEQQGKLTASAGGSIKDINSLESALGQDADGGAGADLGKVAAHLGEVVGGVSELGGGIENAATL